MFLPFGLIRVYQIILGAAPHEELLTLFGAASPNTYTVSHTNPESIYKHHLFGCYGNRLVSMAPVPPLSFYMVINGIFEP